MPLPLKYHRNLLKSIEAVQARPISVTPMVPPPPRGVSWGLLGSPGVSWGGDIKMGIALMVNSGS